MKNSPYLDKPVLSERERKLLTDIKIMHQDLEEGFRCNSEEKTAVDRLDWLGFCVALSLSRFDS